MPLHFESSGARRRVDRRVLALIAAGFLTVLIAGATAGFAVLDAQDGASWVTHTYQVERALGQAQLSAARMHALAFETGGVEGSAFADEHRQLFGAIEHVGHLTADNPRQQVRMPGLRKRAQAFEAELSAGTPTRSSQVAYDNLATLTHNMLSEESRLLGMRIEAERRITGLFWLVLTITGGLLVALAVACVLAIRRYTADLASSQQALRDLNVGLEDAVRARTVDLQRANDEIQRFAYIVSHDLRSPLVNVMGFTAEIEALGKPLRALVERADAQSPGLVDDAARAAVLEELPESTGFIRSSTQKMDRLINAILRLSREGRRAITAEQVDLSGIVEGAIASVRHRLDKQGATAAVMGTLPRITSDRLAVEQIVSNLIDNAVKYLKPGRPGEIRVSGSVSEGRMRLEIADNGRGIDRRDHERVFDLFRRSGQQDQPGEGIGLAHVRASAYRLGGWIDLRSELDQGAIFTVNLPTIYSEQRA